MPKVKILGVKCIPAVFDKDWGTCLVTPSNIVATVVSNGEESEISILIIKKFLGVNRISDNLQKILESNKYQGFIDVDLENKNLLSEENTLAYVDFLQNSRDIVYAENHSAGVKKDKT